MSDNNYRQLWAILRDLNVQGARITKEEAVLEYTDGRTSSAREMTPQEFRNMIQGLNTKTRGYKKPQKRVADPLDNQRKRLLSVFHELAAANPESWGYCVANGKTIVPVVVQAINRLGCVKKPRLNAFTKSELSQLIAQFDIILKREYAASGKHKN